MHIFGIAEGKTMKYQDVNAEPIDRRTAKSKIFAGVVRKMGRTS
jgi:hypothetical protein